MIVKYKENDTIKSGRVICFLDDERMMVKRIDESNIKPNTLTVHFDNLVEIINMEA